MPDRRLQRHRQAFYPERPLDLLVPEMPEMIRRTAKRSWDARADPNWIVRHIDGNPMDTPTLQTRRLVLRPLALSDAAAIQRHFNNWNIIKNLASVVPWPYPDDGAETFIKQQLGRIAAGTEIYQWAIAHNIWLQLYRL